MKKKILLFSTLLFGSLNSFAQCPEITCPADIVVTANPGDCDAVVNFTAPTGIDPCNSTNAMFTTCGATGMNGPTQGQVDTEYTGTDLDGQVTINTQGIQEWTVPFTGTFTFEVAGAQGGPYVNSPGHGAIMKADIDLTAGQVLKILVGQRGAGSATYPHGFAGGGGSFVALSDNTPLIVAGGGGSDYNGAAVSQLYGQTTNIGATAGAAPGAVGNGGNTADNTGPGGGFYTDGNSAYGGLAFVNGGVGAYSTQHTFIEGGFGGGGVRFGGWGEGCAGGYSGGNGGSSTGNWEGGAGGGSFVEATASNLETSNGLYEGNNTFNGNPVVDIADYNEGEGYVTITTGAPLNTTQIAGMASGSNFPVGTTTNTFEADDGNGNTVTCSFDVTVEDVDAPVADQANLADVEAECEVNTLAAPTASDLCDGVITGTHNAVFPISSNSVVVWTYEDASGNSVTQNQNVVITGLNVSVSVSGITITADKTGATYQWINCADSSVVADANGQSFTPTQNGDYAVIITEGSCTDTSACESITTVGLEENAVQHKINVYPNPNNGSFIIDFGHKILEGEVKVLDMQGRVIVSKTINNSTETSMSFDHPAGVYTILVNSAQGQSHIRMIKND